MSDIADHRVASFDICEKTSGDTRWICITSYDRDGRKITEYTMFADQNKPIQMFLGERE